MRTFDADKYLEEGKTFKLGGRIFEVPIIPALTSKVIAENAAAYKRFGTAEEDDESRLVVMKVIASILNQRVPVNERVSAEWVEQHLDMRVIMDMMAFLFSTPEKKNTEDEAEEETSDGMKSLTGSSPITDGSPLTSSTT